MDSLLPCPFCGGEAEIRGEILLFVRCAECGTRLGEGYYATKAEAIAAWNTRAERTCRIEGRYGNQYCTCCGEMVGTWDSESELYIDGNMVELWNYCQNCGAKVIGGTE